jgi:SAM-dependent methyltransferase
MFAGMSADSNYVMASAEASSESERLALLESTRDPASTRRLDAIGVAAGWRCLEAGAGRGSIARWLSERVGPSGSVIAVDIDPRFLTDMPEGVEVRALDINEQDVETSHYDLVHCRALLMHLSDPARALARMAAALRPGGMLLAEEADYGMYHYAGQADAQALTDEIHRELDALAEARVVHVRLGRALPALLCATGLSLLGSEIETQVTRPGWPGFEFVRATALGSARTMQAAGFVADAARIQRLESFFGDPGAVVTDLSLVSAWGRK